MDRSTPPLTTSKKKKKKPQSKHLFAAQSLESAADAFTESATAAELTNLHIQGPVRGRLFPCDEALRVQQSVEPE